MTDGLRTFDRVVIGFGVVALASGVVLAVRSGVHSALGTMTIGALLVIRPLSVARRRRNRSKELGPDRERMLRSAGIKFLSIGGVAAVVAVLGIVGVIPERGGGRVVFVVLLFPAAVFISGGWRALTHGSAGNPHRR